MSHPTLRVIIESPYTSPSATGLIRNRNYLAACFRDCFERGEAPFAGHALYTQFLNDRDPASRKLGMRLSLAWLRRADLVAVYMDFGLSDGMQAGIDAAKLLGIPVEPRVRGVPFADHPDADPRPARRRKS